MTHDHSLQQPDFSEARGPGRDAAKLSTLSLPTLAAWCLEELQMPSAGITTAKSATSELFRRAVLLQDADAWAWIARVYSPCILAWLVQLPLAVPLFELEQGEIAPIDAVLIQVKQNLTAEKLGQLGSHRAILRYLKMCAFAVAADAGRDRERSSLSQTRGGGHVSNTEAQVERETIPPSELWQLIAEALQDDEQLLLLSLAYIQGLTAQEICRKVTERFPTVEDVERTRRAALLTLGRSSRIREYLARLES
jgi:hypothetical protein